MYLKLFGFDREVLILGLQVIICFNKLRISLFEAGELGECQSELLEFTCEWWVLKGEGRVLLLDSVGFVFELFVKLSQILEFVFTLNIGGVYFRYLAFEFLNIGLI